MHRTLEDPPPALVAGHPGRSWLLLRHVRSSPYPPPRRSLRRTGDPGRTRITDGGELVTVKRSIGRNNHHLLVRSGGPSFAALPLPRTAGSPWSKRWLS